MAEVNQNAISVGGSSAGTGTTSLVVKDLDLIATAELVNSSTVVTNDSLSSHQMTGNSQVGTVTVIESPLSVYWKYIKGKFKFTPNLTEVTVLAFLDEIPTGILVPSPELKFSFIYLMSNAGSVMLGIVMADGSSATFPILDYQEGVAIAFEINDLDLNIYVGEQQIGTHQLTNALGKYIQTINMPGMPFTSITYDLTEAYSDISYKLPDDAKDGDVFHITSNGEILDRKLLVNDFIQIYDEKSKIMVTRFKEDKKVLSIEPMQLSDIGDLFAYYDPELRTVNLSGSFYSGIQSINQGLFKVKIDERNVSSNPFKVFAYSGTGIVSLSATYKNGYVEINNPDDLVYGQHVLFTSVIAKTLTVME